ncbi:MAG: imidazole glycerol phosphate synthase subunit HisH [Elusimicrobiota bacterium]
MIVVIDYGLGNIMSVSRALEKAGAAVQISSKPGDIEEADALVLPGVGAFRKAMNNINDLGFKEVLLQYLLSDRPYLGICLGMQILFDESYEHGRTKGFGIIEGTVEKFPTDVKIPHMGWNQVSFSESGAMSGTITENSYFYFDHSYYASVVNSDNIAARTDYGMNFVSAVRKGNIWGVQFHPEKSSSTGLRLLKNFIEYAG